MPVTLKLLLAVLSLALVAAPRASAATGTITNPTSSGTVWKDTGGADIINFCGFILKSGSTFYWYGWDKYAHTVNCYTSTTLGSNSWTEVTGNGFPMFGTGFHGRPAVIYNASTAKYVMITEYSSPVGRNGIQYFTSSAPGGPFTKDSHQDEQIFGINMGDMGVFQDDDGQAYLLVDTDDGGNVNGTNKIVKLNSNYIGLNSVVASWTVTTNRREALGLIKRNGTYILTSSATAGWNSSATWHKTSSTLAGFASASWSTTPTAPNSTTSYNTQHDFLLKISGSLATVYMYAGDRWSQDTGVGFGRNAWYPVVFSGNTPKIIGDDSWTVDPVTGILTAGQTAATAVTKDATVKARFPDTPYGTETILQVSNQSGFEKQTFITFSVSGIPAGATIISAQVKLRCQTDGNGRSITAHTVTNTSWNEATLTWNTPKPTLGAALSTQTNHANGADSVWDVTGAITGNGNFTIGFDTTYSGDTTFSSREGANDPVLVVYYQP
jgi:hypothetical protein